jgi:hypothetical protein
MVISIEDFKKRRKEDSFKEIVEENKDEFEAIIAENKAREKRQKEERIKAAQRLADQTRRK